MNRGEQADFSPSRRTVGTLVICRFSLEQPQETREANVSEKCLSRVSHPCTGMVIIVPPGDAYDPTRSPHYYDPTFNDLQEIGFQVV